MSKKQQPRKFYNQIECQEGHGKSFLEEMQSNLSLLSQNILGWQKETWIEILL